MAKTEMIYVKARVQDQTKLKVPHPTMPGHYVTTGEWVPKYHPQVARLLGQGDLVEVAPPEDDPGPGHHTLVASTMSGEPLTATEAKTTVTAEDLDATTQRFRESGRRTRNRGSSAEA